MITNNITTSAGVNNSTSSETWKPVVGYENRYEVSSLGKVKNVKTGRILKTWSSGNGYIKLQLSKDGKAKQYYIHRLVAEAFIPNPENLRDVNHKDEVKTNNSVSNLEWMSHKDNSNYGTRNEKLSKSVSQIDKKTGVIIAIYPSQIKAEEITGIDNSCISAVCRGTRGSAGGYYWSFVN